MTETRTPAARMHRVTTRRRTLRPLNCPLERELLVAEFADELPPDVALAVREHVAICEVCGARARALMDPYKLLLSIGQEPVTYVPDLRGTVQRQAHSRRAWRAMRRLTGSLGRNGFLALTGIIGIVVLAVFITSVFLLPASAQTTGRSANGLSHLPAAAPGGVLYAETGKLVTVTDKSGTDWQVAEVIAADQRNGAIARSLPASNGSLHIAVPGQLPVAIVATGGVIAELTALNHDRRQALVVFSAKTGSVLFITPLSLPGGHALPGSADALALAPDGSAAYIGLPQDRPTKGEVRALVIDMKSGAVRRTLAPGFGAAIPLPPPPGGLPASAFPSSVPRLNAGGLFASQGANGAMVISPDGQWLFDVVLLADSHGPQYAVVRRFAASTGALAQELAIAGNFTLAQLAAGSSAATPQVYLVRGSPVAEAYVLDATAQGPTLTGDIPLGGPFAPAGATFDGTLSLAPSANGASLYITQDVTQTNGGASGHDLWVVDVQGMGLSAHKTDAVAAGMLLPNAASGDKVSAFLVQNGQVFLIAPDLTGSPTAWISLSDGRPVIRAIAVGS